MSDSEKSFPFNSLSRSHNQNANNNDNNAIIINNRIANNRPLRKSSFLKRTGARVYGSLKRSSLGQFLSLSSSHSSPSSNQKKLPKNNKRSLSFNKMYSLERNERARIGGSTPTSKESINFPNESSSLFELRRHHSDILLDNRGDEHSVSKAKFARFQSLIGKREDGTMTIEDGNEDWIRDNNGDRDTFPNISDLLNSSSFSLSNRVYPIIPDTILEYRDSFVAVLFKNKELFQGTLYVTNIFILFQFKDGPDPFRLRIDLDSIFMARKEDYESCSSAIRIFTEDEIFLLVNIPNRNSCYQLIMNELNVLCQRFLKCSIPTKLDYPVKRGIANPILSSNLKELNEQIGKGCNCPDHYPSLMMNKTFNDISAIELGRLLFFTDPESPPLLSVHRQLAGIITISDTGWIREKMKVEMEMERDNQNRIKRKGSIDNDQSNNHQNSCPCRFLIMSVPNLFYPNVSSRVSIKQFLRFDSLDKFIVEELVNIDDNENYEILIRKCHQTTFEIIDDNVNSSILSYERNQMNDIDSIINEQTLMTITFKLVELKSFGIAKEIVEGRIKTILSQWYEKEIDACYQRIMKYKKGLIPLEGNIEKKNESSNESLFNFPSSIRSTSMTHFGNLSNNGILIFIYLFLSIIFIIWDIGILYKISYKLKNHPITIDTSKNFKDRIEETIEEYLIKDDYGNYHYIQDIEDSVNNLRLILNNLEI